VAIEEALINNKRKKMKSLLILTVMITTNAFATFPLVKFENLYGEFVNNNGKAYAESAKYDLDQVKLTHREIEVKFNKKEKHLVIKDDNTTVELKFDFSFLNVFRFLSFEGVNMKSNLKTFETHLDRLNLYIAPNDFVLEDINVSTDLTQVNGPVSDDTTVLDGFVLNGEITMKSIAFGKIDDKLFMETLIEENANLKSDILKTFIPKAIPITARNLSLSAKKGKFNGKVLLDSWINANLYIGGEIKNLVKENKLQINLQKAKLGYFSIKKLVLKNIKKLNLDSIEVKGQIITVNLGKVLQTSTK
jgi:hypothetical protein